MHSFQPKHGIEVSALCLMRITKQQVDRFCIFHNDPPKCEFSMKWCTMGSPPERLMHKIDLTEGTANSKKYFFIDFDPLCNPSTSPANIESDSHSTSSVVCTAGSSSDAVQAACQVGNISQGN